MEYKLVNFGHEQPVEVRIIAVSEDSQFIDPQFQFPVSMDNHGVEHAIILPPPPVT